METRFAWHYVGLKSQASALIIATLSSGVIFAKANAVAVFAGPG